ncbi:DMT family transporter [Streptomyces coeruleorubidus]|uniref:DMT family transporter n=1 Tax=Streptomyces coeruleorubidus TaxID=116188 RepID=UPI00237FB54F|nr:DMT family transporter [Streptomyces coeruleorubidus]WDV56038.1 DMT family transporter [Streptomyces coeruleorubidus]
MSALALSVLLSLVSAFAYAGGAIVQERVAVSSPGEQYAPLRRPGWWAAVALNGLGGLLHVVALAYGPLSLVQPLGALTIVVALPMAALFVGRKAGATAWRGAIMATVGLAGLLSLVAASDARSLDTAQRVAVALVTAGVVVALMIAGRAAHRHPAVRSMLLATASGIAFGMSSVFTKTVAVDWTGGVSAADVPSLAVIGVLATAGMLLSQASYRGAGLAAPLATLTVVNPVVAAAVGITMFGETFRYGTTGTALALSCGVVAAGGLILLTTERLTHARPESEGTGLEVAGTGLVPADTGLGATGMLPGPAGEPAGSVRGLPEMVGAGSERAGDLSGTVGAESWRAGDSAGTVGGLPGGELPGTVDATLEAVGSLPELAAERPGTVEGQPETVGAPPVAVAALPKALGGGAADLGGAGRGPSGDVPVPVPTVALADAVVDEPEVDPDVTYESGEPSVSSVERPLSYAAFYGIPYVAMPTVDRHRTRIRS